MKRTLIAGLAVLILGAVSAPVGKAQSEPLGTYARSARKNKEHAPASAKVYDNDNLPRDTQISVVGPASDSSQPGADGTSAPATATGEQKKPENKPADDQAKYAQWKGTITAQKEAISLMERELDVAQREYRLRAAAFYADAGNRLRNSGNWDKEDAQYKQQIAQKQKALDDGRKKLDDLQEQARKAGVPSSMRQ